jgi:hypothetical protein
LSKIIGQLDVYPWYKSPLPTKANATENDVLIAQDLGTMRRAQEEEVVDNKKTTKKQWELEHFTKLCALLKFPQKQSLPSLHYIALSVGKGTVQDHIILKNALWLEDRQLQLLFPL